MMGGAARSSRGVTRVPHERSFAQAGRSQRSACGLQGYSRVWVGMDEKRLEPWALRAVVEAALERAASQLREVLGELAERLQPFPTFADATSIQAVEVEPCGLRSSDRGCVVVCPDGELYELDLHLIPGPLGLSDVDQVEEFRRLDLPPEQYIPYAHAAILALASRLE